MARPRDQRCRPGGAHASAGYTLLEALTVVSVLAILLASSLPSFRGLALRSELKNAADRLRSDMGEARATARERGQAVYLSFVRSSDGANWCWGLSLAPGCNCNTDDVADAAYCHLDRDAATAAPLLHVVRSEAFRSVLLAQPSFGTALRFSAVRADLVAGNVAFSSAASGEAVRVVVSALGRLRLCTPADARAVSGLPPC